MVLRSRTYVRPRLGLSRCLRALLRDDHASPHRSRPLSPGLTRTSDLVRRNALAESHERGMSARLIVWLALATTALAHGYLSRATFDGVSVQLPEPWVRRLRSLRL